ncbi:MAG: sacsin N-terminal ATP-binding-like domain-containing protein, partial [Promethearchaeota archaeon]
MNQKEIIENIKNQYLKADDFIMKNLKGALTIVYKIFPYYGSFLMEFIQNADDAESKILKVDLFQNEIYVSNDGKEFNNRDVESICSIGLSSKSASAYIGYLGVGFKSIFIISDGPEIYSGKFSFGFKKDYWSQNEPWQILPVWLDNFKFKDCINFKGFNTIFRIPLKQEGNIDIIREDMLTNLNYRIILFLQNLEEIYLTDHILNYKRKIIKEKIRREKDYEIYKLIEETNDTKEESFWVIFRKSFDVPETVKTDQSTIEWNRQNVKNREIIIAFKLIKENKEYDLIRTDKGTAHIGVYSFLPIKEIESGLPFIIQADFLTNPGRTDIVRNVEWNKWLAHCVYETITHKCIPTFKNHKIWKFSFFPVIFPPNEFGHELIVNEIVLPLKNYLQNEEIFLTEDGVTFASKANIARIDPELRKHINDREIKKLIPDKQILNERFKIPENYYDIDNPFMLNTTFISKSYVDLLRIKAEKKDIDFFKDFYRKELLDYNKSSPSSLYRLKNHIIYLTEDFRIVSGNSLKIPNPNLEIPLTLKHNFNILHPKILEDLELRLFFIEKLKIPMLEKKDTIFFLKSEELERLREEWSNMNNNKKKNKVRYFFSL